MKSRSPFEVAAIQDPSENGHKWLLYSLPMTRLNMDDMIDFYTAAMPRGPQCESRLREEIAFLENKARDLTRSANCAYEKSLARTYTALLQTRRAELARLAKKRH